MTVEAEIVSIEVSFNIIVVNNFIYLNYMNKSCLIHIYINRIRENAMEIQ